MTGGTLVVSRMENLFPQIKKRFEQLDFEKVTVTGAEKDELNMVINEMKPRLLLMSSAFNQGCTPFMTGELHRRFPKLNIAAVSVYDFPVKRAPWFIWHGAKSYCNLWEGYDEFHRGLQIVREGKPYISPEVQKLMDRFEEWPDTKDKATRRENECLLMLCCGYSAERIGNELHITRKSVNKTLGRLYNVFHAHSREEMVAAAWEMGLVTKEDIRFYDKKPDPAELPEWARIQIAMNKYQVTGNK